jgi:hypothetical protein
MFVGKKIPHGFDSLGRSVAVTEKSHRVHRAAEKREKVWRKKVASTKGFR